MEPMPFFGVLALSFSTKQIMSILIIFSNIHLYFITVV